MSDTATAPTETAQPVQEAIKQAAPRERGEAGKFAPDSPSTSISKSINETHDFIKDTARKALGAETDRKALDGVKPKGKDPEAKTDPAPKKDASATAKDKSEPSSKDATRPNEKTLVKARKALELEDWTEEEIADLPESRLLSLGKRYGDKHAQVDREKREAAEAAKTPKTDPSAQSARVTAKEPASEQDDDGEYVKLAEKHFGEFQADSDEGTKAFMSAQARFVKDALGLASTKAEAKHTEALQNLERGLRGEARLERALDRVAVDIPQVEDKDVRPKVIARVLSLMSGDDTREEFAGDLPAAIREACRGMNLKDEGEVRRQAADDELRAAKAGGQPITSGHAPAPDVPDDGNIFGYAARGALRKR